MTPCEAAEALHGLQAYLASSAHPDKQRVASNLRRIRDALIEPQRRAAQLGTFTRTEYEAAVKGLDSLVGKIHKAAQTMNPQDPGRADLESGAQNLLGLKKELVSSYQAVSHLNV